MAAPTALTPTTAPALVDQAKQLGLEVVSLTPAECATIPTDVLPLAAIEQRQLLPYRFDEATKTLFVAVANPAQLKQAAPAELQHQRQLGRRLTLQLIEPSQFAALLPTVRRQFATSAPATATPAKPTVASVDLATLTIPRRVFSKLPRDVAEKFRLIVFEAPEGSNRIKVASDQPAHPEVQRVVTVIKQKRGVATELFAASTREIDDLLGHYGTDDDPVTLTPSIRPTRVPVSSAPVAGKPTVPPPSSPPLSAGGPARQAPTPAPLPSPVPRVAAPPTTHPLSTSTTPQPQPSSVRPPVVPSATVVPPKRSTPPATGLSALPPLPKLPTAAPAPVSASVKPPGAIEAAAKPLGARSPTKPASVAAESMPVDTSPVVRPIPKGEPAKITLAAPLPPLNRQPSFPLPAPTPVSSPAALPPVSTPPPAPPSPPTPVTAEPIRTPAPVAAPRRPAPALEAPGGAAEVTNADVANRTAFASLQPIEATEEQALDTIVGTLIKSTDELESVVKTGLIPKILAAVLQYAVATAASDVHIEATEDGLRVRYRIDGILQDVLKAPVGLHAPLISRIKILSRMKIDEQRIPQDGRFTATTQKRDVDFRVSSLPAIHGEKIVMRLLDKSVGLRPIAQLGIDGVNGERVTAALKKPYGIILVTGPTGSGKTTTLYSMLTTLNQPGVNIVTLEDPVEYELAGITQTQVKPKIGFSFAEGLRSILRQDPDVIMVGEIRDRETASLATHAALTGHLVLSTLHTNTAAGAIPRFINMGVEPFLIASSIEAVIGQRLARKLCEQCRQRVTVSDAVRADVVATLTASTVPALKQRAGQPLEFFGPKGCSECHDGYKGRAGLYEVMTVTPEIESLTAKKAPLGEIQALAIQQGMVTMKQDGLLKALAGLTSLDEVFRVTTSD